MEAINKIVEEKQKEKHEKHQSKMLECTTKYR